MASGQPYDELGRILSEGGEIALGLAILQEMPTPGFLLFFNRRFGSLTPEQQDIVQQLAQEMIDSGQATGEIPSDVPLSLGDIPLNQFLFSGDLQGRRELITVEIDVPGLDRRFQMRLPFADIASLDEIRNAALEQARQRAIDSPQAVPFTEPDVTQDVGVWVLLRERAF